MLSHRGSKPKLIFVYLLRVSPCLFSLRLSLHQFRSLPDTMRLSFTYLAIAGACLSTVLAQDPLQQYTISAENITATYIPYGARLTSLTVPDRDGTDTEVVVGYDDASTYVQDTATNHTYFGEFQLWLVCNSEILVMGAA